MCFGKYLQIVIDLLLRHPGQVGFGHAIAVDAVNVLRSTHKALLVLLEDFYNVTLDTGAHVGRKEMHDLYEVFATLDHLL